MAENLSIAAAVRQRKHKPQNQRVTEDDVFVGSHGDSVVGSPVPTPTPPPTEDAFPAQEIAPPSRRRRVRRLRIGPYAGQVVVFLLSFFVTWSLFSRLPSDPLDVVTVVPTDATMPATTDVTTTFYEDMFMLGIGCVNEPSAQELRQNHRKIVDRSRVIDALRSRLEDCDFTAETAIEFVEKEFGSDFVPAPWEFDLMARAWILRHRIFEQDWPFLPLTVEQNVQLHEYADYPLTKAVDMKVARDIRMIGHGIHVDDNTDAALVA
jgi:hypothetical protein